MHKIVRRRQCKCKNGLYYKRTCSQNDLYVVFIDISKQNLNIHYISKAPNLSTIQCKELDSCNTDMQYTTIHTKVMTRSRAMTIFFWMNWWIWKLLVYTYFMCNCKFKNVYQMGPAPIFLLNSIYALVNYSITISNTSINMFQCKLWWC